MYGKTLLRDDRTAVDATTIVSIIIIIKRRPYSDGRHSETVTCRRRWRCDCIYRSKPNPTRQGGRRFPAPFGDRPPPVAIGEGTLFLSRVKIPRQTRVCVCERADGRWRKNSDVPMRFRTRWKRWFVWG